jgi:hypothetical protein
MAPSLKLSTALITLALATSVESFTVQNGAKPNNALQMSSSVASDQEKPKKRRGPEMSTAVPFLQQPPTLTGELAGDFGFDPLSLAQNKENLWEYREAEIKHARLAMLAAAGWPLSELLDRNIAEFFDVAPALDNADRAPSLLNGGMDKVSPIWWGFCLGLTAAIDMYGVGRARQSPEDYFPGNLNFDPLGLYPRDDEGRNRMQLAEIKHGRVAMLAVTGFAVQEAISRVGVVDETPFFFQPITETISQVMSGFLN